MFQIKIAGLVVGIDSRSGYLKKLCRDYMAAGEQADFSVRVSKRDLAREWGGASRLRRWIGRPFYESNSVYRQICLKMIDYDAFLLHAAVIEAEGQAVAFAAKSGVGKSTHIRLWRQRYGDRVRVINGDKPICRYFNGELYACGTPWNGKEKMGSSAMAPLKALCFLERAEENRLERLTPGAALNRLFQQVLLPEDAEQMDRFLGLLDNMLEAIPCWLLRCNMSPEAAETARRGLLGGD